MPSLAWIDDAVKEIVKELQAAAAKPKPTYPPDHKAGMRVPPGGSNCAKCEYLADNKTDCTNRYFQAWNGSPVIAKAPGFPGSIDEYCTDWFQAKDGIEAHASSEKQETHTSPLAGKREAGEPGMIFRGVRIIGFTSIEEEQMQAYMSRIPQELIRGVDFVRADPSLDAIHGKYDVNTRTVLFNPHTFISKVELGRGIGKINHAQLTVVHEFMHALYQSLPEKIRDEWQELSGWMIGTQVGQTPPYEEKRPGWPHLTSKWTHKEGVAFSRHYAEKNPDEDFADSAAFFILGKATQIGDVKKRFLGKLLLSIIRKYPQASLQSPEK